MALGPTSDTCHRKRDDDDTCAHFHDDFVDIETGGGVAGGGGAAASSSSSPAMERTKDMMPGTSPSTFAGLPPSYGDLRPPHQMAEVKDERIMIGKYGDG